LLAVNKAPTQFAPEEVKKTVEETYGCEVAAVIPHSDDLMTLASAGVFSMRFPHHPLSAIYRSLGRKIIGLPEPDKKPE
jgi:hypothetical protein